MEKKPKEPDWENLPSIHGYMNVYIKEDVDGGKLAHWRRYWVECEKGNVIFYDFIDKVNINYFTGYLSKINTNL